MVQGSKNKVTKAPITKAPFGEVILKRKFCILGLNQRGISVRKPPGLYFIKSLMFKIPIITAVPPKIL